jgi:type VI secretion system protein ImpF
MATGYTEPEVTPTLLDRLIDSDPESQRDVPLNAWERMREFRSGLCRDLTALLNTRRANEGFDRGYEESTNSILSFGIVDFTSYNLKKGIGQEQLRKSIERAIRRFEPRLERVDVSIQESDARQPTLRIQISAVLRTEAQDPVVFEATFHRDSRRIAVSGGV